MMFVNDLVAEDVAFAAQWASADFLRDEISFTYKLYISRTKLYVLQFYNEEKYFEHQVLLLETLSTVTLKDSTGFDGPHSIFLDVFCKHSDGVALRLSFDNTKEGRNLAQSIFVALNKALPKF